MFGKWLGKRSASTVAAPLSIPPSNLFEGNDGPWSTFPFQLGTPPQTVNLLISTTTSQTWVVLPGGCIQSDPANCTTARGGVFDPKKSSTWKQDQDIANGLSPLIFSNKQSQNNDTGLYGYDTIALSGSGSPSLIQQVVAGVETKLDVYLGLFGLSPNSVDLPQTSFQLPDYFSTLNQSNLIPSLSYGYTAGNPYRPGPAYGSLTLGGYDALRFEPNEVTFSLQDPIVRGPTVNIGQIILYTNDEVADLGTANESITAVIDSSIPYIVLPDKTCEQFEISFGLVWDNAVQGYLVNETLHSNLISQNASVTFNIGNSSTIPGQGFNISLPYAAFDLTAGPPLLKNVSRYFPLRRSTSDVDITLGRTFLQEAYLIVNYEHNNFSISQSSWDNNGKSNIVAIKTISENTTPSSNKLSGGAIAGIVIGALAGVALIALLGWFLLRKRNGRSSRPKSQKPTKIELPQELDAAGNDPYKVMMEKQGGAMNSPELDSAPHKGHELDSSEPPSGPHSPTVETALYELDSGTRHSQVISPGVISPISDGRSDATRMHGRQLSDPSSIGSGNTESSTNTNPRFSDPISPMRERSDARRRMQRGISETASSNGGVQEKDETDNELSSAGVQEKDETDELSSS